MLSSVLRSKKAIKVNIEIMRAFARLREILASNKDFARRLEELEKKFSAHDRQFRAVFEAIREMIKTPEKPRRKIGYTAEESKAVYHAESSGFKSSLEQDVLDEVKKRYGAYRRGEIKTLPAFESLEKIRRKMKLKMSR